MSTCGKRYATIFFQARMIWILIRTIINVIVEADERGGFQVIQKNTPYRMFLMVYVCETELFYRFIRMLILDNHFDLHSVSRV